MCNACILLTGMSTVSVCVFALTLCNLFCNCILAADQRQSCIVFLLISYRVRQCYTIILHTLVYYSNDCNIMVTGVCTFLRRLTDFTSPISTAVEMQLCLSGWSPGGIRQSSHMCVCVCVCVCVSFAPVSLQWLKSKHQKLQHRSNATMSSNSIL